MAFISNTGCLSVFLTTAVVNPSVFGDLSSYCAIAFSCCFIPFSLALALPVDIPLIKLTAVMNRDKIRHAIEIAEMVGKRNENHFFFGSLFGGVSLRLLLVPLLSSLIASLLLLGCSRQLRDAEASGSSSSSLLVFRSLAFSGLLLLLRLAPLLIPCGFCFFFFFTCFSSFL